MYPSAHDFTGLEYHCRDSGGPAQDNRDRSRADRCARRGAPVAAHVAATVARTPPATLAGRGPAIPGSEDQRRAQICSVTFGYVRLCSVMFGYVRLCSVMFGYAPRALRAAPAC